MKSEDQLFAFVALMLAVQFAIVLKCAEPVKNLHKNVPICKVMK